MNKNKKVPDRKICQGRINKIRGTTLIYGKTPYTCRILSYPRCLTHIRRCRILRNRTDKHKIPFHCTLSGPFAELFFARITAPRTLCASISSFIPASSVSMHIISLKDRYVNRKNKFLFLIFYHQYDSVSGNSKFFAGKSEFFLGCSFDAYLRRIASADICDPFTHLCDIRCKLRRLSNDR